MTILAPLLPPTVKRDPGPDGTCSIPVCILLLQSRVTVVLNGEQNCTEFTNNSEELKQILTSLINMVNSELLLVYVFLILFVR